MVLAMRASKISNKLRGFEASRGSGVRGMSLAAPYPLVM